MKNFFKIIFLLVILNLSSVSIAQDWSFSISPFYTFQSENLKNSYGLQIGTEYLTQKNISFNLSGGLFSPGNNNQGVFIGDVPTIVSWLDFIIKIYPVESVFKPYLGIGLGYLFINRKSDSHFTNTFNFDGEIYKGDIKDDFGFQVVVGSDIYKTLYFQLKYFILNTKMDRTAKYYLYESGVMRTVDASSKNINVNLNTLLIMVGFHF
jgi:outer membrane protein W